MAAADRLATASGKTACIDIEVYVSGAVRLLRFQKNGSPANLVCCGRSLL